MRIYNAAVLLLCAVASHLIFEAASIDVTSADLAFEGITDTKKDFNIDEDVTLVCTVKTDGGLPKKFYLRWYKIQSTDSDVYIGRDSNELLEPAFSNTDKYSISYDEDETTFTTSLFLRIKGVSLEDAGQYYCDVGVDSDRTKSAQVKLIVNPNKDESQIAKLESAAPQDNGVYKFENGAYKVSCSATINTNSEQLKLVMMLGNQDITQDFKHTSMLEWSGDAGVQTPATNLELHIDQWVPKNYGADTMKCILLDNEMELDSRTIDIAKDKPPVEASLKCEGTQEEPLKEGTLDYAVSCIVQDYEFDRELMLKYSFMVGDDVVSVSTEDKEGKNGRRGRKGTKTREFLLFMPRITSDMTENGGVTYNISLYADHGSQGGWIHVPEADTSYKVTTLRAEGLRLSGESSTMSASALLLTLSLIMQMIRRC